MRTLAVNEASKPYSGCFIHSCPYLIVSKISEFQVLGVFSNKRLEPDDCIQSGLGYLSQSYQITNRILYKIEYTHIYRYSNTENAKPRSCKRQQQTEVITILRRTELSKDDPPILERM